MELGINFLIILSFIFPTEEWTHQSIWKLPLIEEDQIDIGLWSLVIAKEYDFRIDILHYSAKLDELVDTVNRILPTWEKDTDLLYAVKVVLYDPGPWNHFQPVSYDLEDPLGHITKNRFLSTYLDTKKGNCITMPNLVIAVIKRLDPQIPIACVLAPLHTFCRLQDRKTGQILNFEATNGNPARDEWVIEQNGVPQKGIDSGLYMRSLTKKEYLGVLIGSLAFDAYSNGNVKKALEYNNLVLDLYPSSGGALANRAVLLDEQGFRFVQKVKLTKKPVTQEERARADWFKKEAERYYQQALNLGWKATTDAERNEYLKIIREEKEH